MALVIPATADDPSTARYPVWMKIANHGETITRMTRSEIAHFVELEPRRRAATARLAEIIGDTYRAGSAVAAWERGEFEPLNKLGVLVSVRDGFDIDRLESEIELLGQILEGGSR
jgi:hypothetical protein